MCWQPAFLSLHNSIDTMIDKERMVAAYIRQLEQREQRKKAARHNVQDRTLTTEEVGKILSYQPDSESLERARFLFIIILHTGMRKTAANSDKAISFSFS